MNEQNEINGDLRDEYLALQESDADAAEREECNRDAPLPAPLTDAELDDWYRTWARSLVKDAPDLTLVGEHGDGIPIWEFTN